MKIIAFDLDQTLLRSDKTLSDYTLETLAYIRSLGHKIVTNTARSEIFTNELSCLPECDYYIYNGGALIKDADGNTLSRDEIPNEKVLRIIEDFEKVAEDYSVQTDEVLFTSRESYRRPEAKYFNFSAQRFPHAALKLLAAIDSDEDATKIAEKYGIELTTYVGGKWRRFNTLGTDKLSAMKRLCEMLGVSLSDCLFFGDDFGDLSAIDGVGIGVLMKNAEDEHKAPHRRVSKYTNDEDGVARFLAEYFLI